MPRVSVSRRHSNMQALASPVPTQYTLGEEIAHCVTHGAGALLAIAGLAILVAFASLKGNAWHVVSVSVYGATLVLLFTSSTLYHGIVAPRAKAVLRHLDHAAIFLLIAGTYTPFALVNLRGPWGWTIFSVIWTLAVAGVLMQTRLIRRAKWVNALLYVLMGWLVIVAIEPLAAAVETGGLVLLVAGGLAYTLGTVFYVWKRLKFHHAIWHGFVLLGSALHFFAVLFYVIP
jgi:hemolysin III